MFSLLLSILTIVCCLLCCYALPIQLPCCPGSQHVVAIMAKHIDTFSSVAVFDGDEATVCSTVNDTVNAIQKELHTAGDKCPMGGAEKLAEQIKQQLTKFEHLKMEITNEDVCSYHLGFARAMFDLAASVADHAGKGAEWHTLSKQFEQQSHAIKEISEKLNIYAAEVPFAYPFNGLSAHLNVPSPSQVIAEPGKLSAFSQGKETEFSKEDKDF